MQKPSNLPVSLVTAAFATLRLLYQSQIPYCPKNSNNHHYLANTLFIQAQLDFGMYRPG